MPADQPMSVVLCWHMHQPEYRDLRTGKVHLPWTYLHATKDYVDMAAHLEAVPEARAVVNFAPILLEQIEDYILQIDAYLVGNRVIRDPLLAELAEPALPGHAETRLQLMRDCLRANRERMIARFPPFQRLVTMADWYEAHPDSLIYASNYFLADLLVWYHLSWMAESVQRSDARIKRLRDKGHNFNLHDRRELLQIVLEQLQSIVPRYRALAESGQVELSMSPYAHPIVPLLLDMECARESMPGVHLPVATRYPAGEARARWHVRQGVATFERVFGRKPVGLWPSEGGVSQQALALFSEFDFRWVASGGNVLNNSHDAASKTCSHRVYRFGDVAIDCFFRDDGLSDLIGFSYSDWHADDAVANLIGHMENIAKACPDRDNCLITIILDGENAWEYYPENGYHFLSQLYRGLAKNPLLQMTTFEQFLREKSPTPAREKHLVAGSWVYGTFSTWIGNPDKNRGWEILVEAKQGFDAQVATGRLSPEELAAAERQLAICEGSDWFWWFGDYNPSATVNQFDQLYRMHLANLYQMLHLEAPAYLSEIISRGGGHPSRGGVMRQHSEGGPWNAPRQVRQAGVLLHPTSLAGPGYCGDFGADARRFVDLIAEAGLRVWQVLPLGPPHQDGCPYQCFSVHAGNEDLIDLQWLVERGWLSAEWTGQGAADREAKYDALDQACTAFLEQTDTAPESPMAQSYEQFLQDSGFWLEDYVRFRAFRDSQEQRSWTQWPVGLRDRDAAVCDAMAAQLASQLDRLRVRQFIFDRQWRELRDYAATRDVQLFGDIPIFVHLESADVWAHQRLFVLDEQGQPITVTGVPPDYFCAEGQLWGNPQYHWQRMRDSGFEWWLQRFDSAARQFDIVRIDHFRALQAYWEIPAGATSAREGRWVEAPGRELLHAVRHRYPKLKLVAENLGLITADVEALRAEFALPGMVVLQFAFDGSPDNPYLNHMHKSGDIVYTGTHDNDTTLGWFESLDAATRARVYAYFGHPEESMPWMLIHQAMASIADTVIIPWQDFLGLDGRSRMNTPGISVGNWRWRFDWQQVPQGLAARIRHLLVSNQRQTAAPSEATLPTRLKA